MKANVMPITHSAAWQELTARREELSTRHLRELFAEDPDRFTRLSLSVDGLLADFSKQRIDGRTLELLIELARSADIVRWRERLFAGEPINTSENRAVMHPALRHLKLTPFPTADHDVMPEVREVRAQMRAFSSGESLVLIGSFCWERPPARGRRGTPPAAAPVSVGTWPPVGWT